MPKRTETEEEENLQPVSNTNAPVSDEGDAWDKIMGMKSASMTAPVEDAHGFNKINTNFYLLDGEECLIQLLSDVPIIFAGHNLKLTSKKGKSYFVVEACQKSIQNHCVLCSTKAKIVGEARQYIAFPILDFRGTWKAGEDGSKGGWDNKPAPKIFLMPLGLAKGLKKIRDEAGGTLVDKVLKLSKEQKNYIPQIQMDKLPGGTFAYRKSIAFKGNIPDINVLYAPQSDETLNRVIDYTREYADDSPENGEDTSSGLFQKK